MLEATRGDADNTAMQPMSRITTQCLTAGELIDAFRKTSYLAGWRQSSDESADGSAERAELERQDRLLRREMIRRGFLS